MNTKQRMQLVINTGISMATVIKWDRGGEVTEAHSKTLSKETEDLGFTRASKKEDNKTGKAGV